MPKNATIAISKWLKSPKDKSGTHASIKPFTLSFLSDNLGPLKILV